MSIRNGEVILINFPFTDQSSSKVRPALVVSRDEFNQGEDFTAVPISARRDVNDAFVFEMDSRADWFAGTGLKPASRYVRWSELMTLSSIIVRRRLGRFPLAELGRIRAEIRRIFE